jgi:hypothetical protein
VPELQFPVKLFCRLSGSLAGSGNPCNFGMSRELLWIMAIAQWAGLQGLQQILQ